MTQTSTETSVLRIGSRGSPLALVQAREVQSRLAAACDLPAARIAIETIRTSGDMIPGPLAEAGGKGLFTKEIEEALLAGARDAFVSRKAEKLQDLPNGAVVGTGSPRRQALVKHLRPDLVIVPLRGNVETRLRKIEAGDADATVLALAGLKRLGLAAAARAIFTIEEFLPAVGQGAIGIETRADDSRTRALLTAIDDPDTATALSAERAFLAVLDGTCRTPSAGYAQVSGGTLRFRGLIAKIDGSEALEVSREGRRGDAAAIGADAGRELKGRAGSGFFVRD